MATLMDSWTAYENLVLTSCTTLSRKVDHGRWTNYVEPFFGRECKLTEITSKNVFEFRVHLHGVGLGPQSVKHCLSLLRRILRKAMQWNIYSGPLPHFEMPKFDNKRVRFLTHNEAFTLLSTLRIKSNLWHDVAGLAINTGLRASELFSLTPAHVDLKSKLVHVFDTKSKKNRAVPLNVHAEKILLRNLESIGRNLYIFQSSRGTRLQWIGKPYKEAVDECRFNEKINDHRQRVVFHTLRHTFASWLVQAGNPIALISQLLGHSDIQMTMRYAHLAPENGFNAVQSIENFFSGVNI